MRLNWVIGSSCFDVTYGNVLEGRTGGWVRCDGESGRLLGGGEGVVGWILGDRESGTYGMPFVSILGF